MPENKNKNVILLKAIYIELLNVVIVRSDISRESEVGDFNRFVVLDENITCSQISMQDLKNTLNNINTTKNEVKYG